MNRNNSVSRRRFISSTAAGLLTASIPASTAAADPEGDSKYPVYAEGQRIHEFKPLNDDHFQHRERFVSQELQAAFGKASVVLDSGAVHRKSVPDRYKNPDRSGTTKYRDSGVFGTWDQHANAERELRNDVTIQSSSYTGPLYIYKSEDLAERAAPINVGWRYYHSFNASDVNDIMWDNGWDGTLTSTDRYVLVMTDTQCVVRKQAYHTKKPTGWTTQWHGRLWNLPDYEDDGYDVIGSYHHDPWDHGWVTNADWRFSESRQEVSDDWESWGYYANTQDVGNGDDFDSSAGKFDYI